MVVCAYSVQKYRVKQVSMWVARKGTEQTRRVEEIMLKRRRGAPEAKSSLGSAQPALHF